jgi:hypothetical protein
MKRILLLLAIGALAFALSYGCASQEQVADDQDDPVKQETLEPAEEPPVDSTTDSTAGSAAKGPGGPLVDTIDKSEEKPPDDQ